jgi:soluble cytochrome b562
MQAEDNVRNKSSSLKIPQALSKAQERKAVEYVEDSFMDITSAFKKRLEPSMTKLPTLTAYLDSMQKLLAFILQIPPIDPSTHLRTAFLLRLTGDVMTSVPGYPPQMKELQTLLDFLDDLDQAWSAVLKNQVWDPAAGEGVDLIVCVDEIKPGDPPIRSSPVSQTEQTRLRSLLVTGTAELEEWMTGLNTSGEDYQIALQRAGLLQGFDDLFSVTLSEMGTYDGSVNDPAGMEGTC